MSEENSFFKRSTIPPYSQKEGEGKEPPPLPKTIGPYEVKTYLDTGGMSHLYLALHPETRQAIAVKVLSPRFLSHPEMTERFLKEAEIIALADHPNIIKLFGYGEWEGGLYIAMEFVRGVSLRSYLQHHPLSLKKALEMILEISYALCHLHIHGVIHRDLKPENILVTEQGHIKVIDFGIAQLIDPQKGQEREQELKNARLVGTPIYMSPEQREHPESVSYPSDIYSLGIVAYELILGTLHSGQLTLSLLPKGAQKVVAKALNPKLTERYLDIVDFISELSTYMHSPQFEKDRKETAGNIGETFDKLSHIQERLLPKVEVQFSGIDTGFCFYKSFSLATALVNFNEKKQRLLIGEPLNNGVDSLMQLIYLMGGTKSNGLQGESIEGFFIRVNDLLVKGPIPSPISFFALEVEKERGSISYLGSNYGSFWKISGGKVESLPGKQNTLGSLEGAIFHPSILKVQKGDKVVFVSLLLGDEIYEKANWENFLSTLGNKSAKESVDLIWYKAKAEKKEKFEESPFIALVLGFD